MARPKKPAAAEPLEWIALPHELYEATCAELVTFSHKTVNSNAPAGGIRLAPEQALPAPCSARARYLLWTIRPMRARRPPQSSS